MLIQIAHLYATACLTVVFFQVALIGGAPLGAYTQGGQHKGRLPPRNRVIAALSIPVLLAQALAILSAAGFPGLGWPRCTGWAALAMALVTMLLNQITPSRRERALWGPITIVMAALAGYVMVVSRGA
ncbi:hypothetical protein [Tropicibacter oceani]|uniref:Uncharacterized protein n=1 Tax=Tropicibacter oceani TaxID=3058420 RepID=A0ABY8QD56_9RHOB|nr:hypothetical protein [Tropicibacter oceani]WGW02554.1 hypothetical protein QF118_11420 [Tropicibacter oceani]